MATVYGIEAGIWESECDRIEAEFGKVTAELIVEQAKDSRNVLHSAFHFDKVDEAAQQHWLHIAGTALRKVRVIREKRPPLEHREIRVAVEKKDGPAEYKKIGVLQDDECAVVLRDLERQIAGLTRTMGIVKNVYDKREDKSDIEKVIVTEMGQLITSLSALASRLH